jgi:hypothetical protein
MQTVRRESFLNQLEAVAAGLSSFDVVEQSTCFVFKDGYVVTFNDEVACRMPTELNITGAVKSAKLIALLRDIEAENIDVEADEDAFRISAGKNERAWVLMEKDILMPIDKLETPKKWREVGDDFSDAVKLAAACAGKDVSKFVLTCVHISQDLVEGCDNTHAVQYRTKTGIKESVLVRAVSLRSAAAFDMTDVSLSESWIHFRNPAELIVSCRRHTDEYIKMDNVFTGKGKKIAFPKDMAKAVMRAQIFSSEDADKNFVHVALKPGLIMVKGTGATGGYEKRSKIAYDGPKVKFAITPELFRGLIQDYNQVMLLEDRLLVSSGSFSYVVCLEE